MNEKLKRIGSRAWVDIDYPTNRGDGPTIELDTQCLHARELIPRPQKWSAEALESNFEHKNGQRKLSRLTANE